MRGRIATCSERLPRCEVASVSPQSSESALAGRRGCVPRWQETGGRRRQNRQYCGYFMSALTPYEFSDLTRSIRRGVSCELHGRATLRGSTPSACGTRLEEDG